ncbi:AAA domain-containing protein [Metamycoplasma neophronis]|uniref:ATP-binding protein n=1 Tax=Metamycoplasma neophronis TaxID=872983 RepID=A0ABY2YZN6_9BACT|nr:AAA domain-containing protein [Metamycoplasma neophronis]TPR53712.1 ATP-binding protein [Metamycoplasma neophronis]
MNKQDAKYQTLMANLLNIDTFDTSLYSAIDNERFFDVYKNFGSETFDKIFKNYNINCVLTEIGNQEISEKVKAANSKQDIISTYKEYNRRIEDNIFKLLSSDLEKAKKLLISRLETEFQKSIVKWKKILNKAQNINIETNIWPLHIGFFFISIKTDKKTIYAPLFFKEVTLEIKNSLVYLKSNSDVRVNSKLITFLGQEGFMLNVDNFDFANLSIEQVFNYFKKEWSPIYNMPESLKTKIPNLSQDTITNTSIEFHPGMVLGFYNVSSGYLWNQMKKIIENDEFEDILNPDFNKNLYREKIDKVIFDKKFKLYKIQKTNFSQDMATISALYQDTIIWGPPGTGKSQTISNLIANIIARGFTALVVSQKKAALDVLKKRLKKLSIFCLFALNDKNLREETFYKPLKDFIYYVENFKLNNTENGIQVFSNDDKQYVDLVSKISKLPNLNNILNFYSAVVNSNFTETTFNNLKRLDHSLKYDLSKSLLDKKEIKKYLYETNRAKKPHAFTIYPANIREAAEIIAEDNTLFTVDIDKALRYIDLVDYESIKQMHEDYQKILQAKTIDVNDDATLTRMILQSTINKMSDFTDEQKRQYTAFAMAIRTGHLKPYKFFHKHKEMIKLLFPIIVTTPELDLSMWDKEEFDYAILDESSQIFIEKGIPILYLAKRKVLAGDNQQMQPTRWFSVSYSFDEEDDFGNIESLLDYATARGVYSILLDKNYRSKQASLMTFSSKHFYDSKLDVIDDYELSLNNEKAIEVVQVDGNWDNSMNEAEGKAVIELAKENLKKYEKIIILVFNAKQQDYLINSIFGFEPELEEALNNDRLTLKNIENIQGDEADLVIMSVVYDKKTSLYGTYVARQGGKNALNVAISRAREKVIVVKSIYADDVEITERSTTDMIIFKEWLKFLDLPLEEQKNYLDGVEDFLETKTLSMPTYNEFKNEIFKELQEFIRPYKDLKLLANYSVGTKNIDIVLVNTLTNKLVQGFIIDGYDYINDYKKYLKFKDNIKFLQSKAYPLIIISLIQWPVDKPNILATLREKADSEVLSNANLKVNQQILKASLDKANTEEKNTNDDFLVEEFDDELNPIESTTELIIDEDSSPEVNTIEEIEIEEPKNSEMNEFNEVSLETHDINENLEDDDVEDFAVENGIVSETLANDIDEHESLCNAEQCSDHEMDDIEDEHQASNYLSEVVEIEHESPHIDNEDSINEPELDCDEQEDNDKEIAIPQITSDQIEISNYNNDFLASDVASESLNLNHEYSQVDDYDGVLDDLEEQKENEAVDEEIFKEYAKKESQENKVDKAFENKDKANQLKYNTQEQDLTSSDEFVDFAGLFDDRDQTTTQSNLIYNAETEELENIYNEIDKKEKIKNKRSAKDILKDFDMLSDDEKTTEFEIHTDLDKE